jgi:hypothetical protein
MDGWDILRWGSLAIGGAVAAGAIGRALYRGAVKMYDDLYERWRQVKHDRLTLNRIEDQNELHNIRAIPPDERGRYPLLYGKSGILRDPNNLRSFTLTAVLDRWPQLEKLDWMLRRLIAMQGVPSPAARQLAAPIDNTVVAPPWPEFVTMEQALRGQHPTITDLVVGAYPAEEGGLGVVSDSLHNLMHVLEVGSSGWGKSTWLRSFLYQVALAPEPVEVVAVDPSGSAFNALKGWGKLRYPVARTTDNAIAVLEQVSEEITRRRDMYEQHPEVEKLDEYNRVTGADMPPWVVVVDEGTHLLHKRGVGHALREVVQTARQYGIYALMAGQSAKASVVDTEIRDQFSTRLGFRTSRRSLNVVFDDTVDRPSIKGQAWVQMVGSEDPQLVQGPWVDKSEFMRALSNGGPKYQMPVGAPEVVRDTQVTDGQVQKVLEMREAGESKRAIQKEVFGYVGGAAHDRVNEVLEGVIITTDTVLEAPDTMPVVSESSNSAVDWCDFCARSAEMAQDATFTTCRGCGVAVCSECADDGLCPDCQEESPYGEEDQ